MLVIFKWNWVYYQYCVDHFLLDFTFQRKQALLSTVGWCRVGRRWMGWRLHSNLRNLHLWQLYSQQRWMTGCLPLAIQDTSCSLFTAAVLCVALFKLGFCSYSLLELLVFFLPPVRCWVFSCSLCVCVTSQRKIWMLVVTTLNHLVQIGVWNVALLSWSWLHSQLYFLSVFVMLDIFLQTHVPHSS